MLSESQTSAPSKTHASLLSLEFRIPVKAHASEGERLPHDVFSEMFVRQFPPEALNFSGKFAVPGMPKIEEAYFSVSLPATAQAAWRSLVAEFRRSHPEHRLIIHDPHRTSLR